MGNGKERQAKEGEDRGTENKEKEQTGDGEAAVCGGGLQDEDERRLKEIEHRKETESRRIQSIEEGEDTQKPATF
ncbi:hypothetical protein NDU88_002675 [Pleurodeles waltl]|uniref:Uncharacterized protein n=1 Tax=Pleurodeles waltl TaxID=8319 RepID=A0AAV7P8Y8_PLEWA|nr:hypothetical protein NDU88_002675 [Pleurodeles waltl]